MFRSQGRSPANRFRGQCPLYPLPYPIVPVLSRCVGAGTPAVRSWSLCWHVPFLRVLKHVLKGGAPRKSIPRSVSAPVPDRPGSFRLCWAGHARRSVLVVVLPCSVLKGGAPRESIPRSVSATVPDRPGSFPLCDAMWKSVCARCYDSLVCVSRHDGLSAAPPASAVMSADEAAANAAYLARMEAGVQLWPRRCIQLLRLCRLRPRRVPMRRLPKSIVSGLGWDPDLLRRRWPPWPRLHQRRP